jgi:HSP20 family protein
MRPALWRGDRMFAAVPAMDLVETDKNYEITADLPGLKEKNIAVKVANGCLTIRGEKHEEKEGKRKDYYLRERRFGSYERLFRLPEGADTGRIEATFKKGVLAVTLPKTAEAQKSAKRTQIKAG